MCNMDCNTEDCFYDFGKCFGCALGCMNSMVGDRHCDIPCFTIECGFDGNDCFSHFCNENCAYEMIGDGQCNSHCYTENCNYDGGDCNNECSPGCYWFMINDELCEPACITESCGYDIKDCNNTIWVALGANGIGTQDSPFGTIQEALANLTLGVSTVFISQGIYYFNEKIIINAQGGLFLQGEGIVEIRYLSPNCSIVFKNMSVVSINNIIFDGSELWMKGCDSDLCRFIDYWECFNSSICNNSHGHSAPYNSIYVQKYQYYCVNYIPLSIFQAESTGQVLINSFTIQNSDFIGHFISSTDSSLALKNNLYHLKATIYIILSFFIILTIIL